MGVKKVNDSSLSLVADEIRAKGGTSEELTFPQGFVQGIRNLPEPGTVDTEMSDTSENAVQNKVIKAYVDSEVAGIETTTLTTQVATNPSQPIKALFEDGTSEVEFGKAGDVYEMHIRDGDLQNTAFLTTQKYVDDADEELQTQLGDLTALDTEAKGDLVNALNEVYEKCGEPFRVKQWAANNLNVTIPICTTEIANTQIGKFVFSIDAEEGALYQIVGMIAYEVFDAATGGNRINCWPVCQFTGNGQKELGVRFMCGGTSNKVAKRINAWVLLKRRQEVHYGNQKSKRRKPNLRG